MVETLLEAGRGVLWLLRVFPAAALDVAKVLGTARVDFVTGAVESTVDLDMVLARLPGGLAERLQVRGSDALDDVRVRFEPASGLVRVSAERLCFDTVRADDALAEGVEFEQLEIIVGIDGSGLAAAGALISGDALDADLTARVQVGRLSVAEVRGAGGHARRLALWGLELSATGLGSVMDGSISDPADVIQAEVEVEGLRAAHLAGAGAELVDLACSALRLGFDQVGGDVRASAVELTAKRVHHTLGQVEGLVVEEVECVAGGEGPLVPLLVRWPPMGLWMKGQASAIGVQSLEGQGAQAQAGRIHEVYFVRAMTGHITARCGEIHVRAGRFDDPALRAAASRVLFRDCGVEWDERGLTASSASVEAHDIAAKQITERVPGVSDSPPAAFLQQTAPAVDGAAARVELPMAEGRIIHWVPVRVKPRTQAVTDVVVEGGRVLAQRSDVVLTRPVRLLWMEFRGAYLTEDGRLKVDLGGLIDPDLTGPVNRQLGRERGAPLPTDVVELATIADDILSAEAPALDSRAATRHEIADMARAHVDAHVTLSSARLQVADQVVDLGDDAGRLHVTGSLDAGLTASFKQLLVDAADLRSHPSRLWCGRTQLMGGTVHATDPASGIEVRLQALFSSGVRVRVEGVPAPLLPPPAAPVP